jgi:S-adenosylmethionine synthetase
MNEENNTFSLDVQAETAVAAPSLDGGDSPAGSQTIMQAVALPETTLFTPTPVTITEAIHPAKAKVELNPEIKIGAEEAYSKAEDTEKKLNEVRAGMLDMYNDMKNDWIPNKNKDEFEERPTTEPNNLIFDARRDRMSMEPKWA